MFVIAVRMVCFCHVVVVVIVIFFVAAGDAIIIVSSSDVNPLWTGPPKICFS